MVQPSRLPLILLLAAFALFLPSCGGSGSGGGGGQQVTPPATPTGLAATAGNAQVSLTWNGSTGATSYNVQRGTVSGGPYATSFSTTTASYTDSSVTNGTTYYYVVAAANSAGASGNSSQVSATPTAPVIPAVPTGLAATAGNAQVNLTWNASTGATSYNVGRSTTSGGPYSTVSSPTTNAYTDSGLTNGTIYYYVVAAVNSAGTSVTSSQVSATPEAANTTNVQATINVLANRHTISPYIYGGSFPQDTAHITDAGLTVVRWGGNGASTYNWQLETYNADNDYFFEDFNFFGLSGTGGNGTDGSSTQFIADVKAAGSNPLMTMVMLDYVAQSAETPGTGGNGHWSFSVARDGQQCQTDQYNSDAGDGITFVSGCPTDVPSNPTYLTATPTDLSDAYFPLLDDHTQACASGNCVYRDDWATALATAFGNATCSFPYYPAITSCHFYDMDNEIDIWSGTHRDVHPDPTTYDELSNVYLTEAANLKTWDPQAVRLGWVSCCWSYYWNSAAGSSDKSAHANIDFMPWWLNQAAWTDAVNGTRTLDIFDVHAYPETSSNGLTTAQARALTLSSTRDWWDPTYTSQAWFGGVNVTTNQPLPTEPFRIPRLRAMANMIYPGTPLSFTEWNFGTLGDTDFATALSDVDAYGIMGRERLSLASRWTAASPANPNYLSLKLFTNYDNLGQHHGFGTISVSDSNNGNPSLFSSYAALNSAGTVLTIMVLNKDPANSAQVALTTTGFTPTTYTSYTLSQSSPSSIVASASQSWSQSINFAPYTATLLVVNGSLASTPASAWDLNPDTVMVAANGTTTLQPKIISGTANVSLTSAVFDSFEGAAACTAGTLSLTTSTITTAAPGEITVTAGATPGFCHYTVTGTDSGATQTEGGWIVVGNPAATLAQTSGNGQSAAPGAVLPNALTVTLTPGQSGGTNTGASILFTTNAGALSNGTTSGSQVIAVTNSSGVASVTLTLPSTAGNVTVTAEGPYGLGHPLAPSFSETAN